MHTMSRLLFGLAFLLVFAIGCQKNPTAVRATKNAAGKCDPELVKKLAAVGELKKTIEGLQKSGSDAAKLSSQISTKSAECKVIIDTYGKGKLEALDCTAADGKTKITTAAVKDACGAEFAKPAVPVNDPAKMKNFCSDSIAAKLQELTNLEAKKVEAAKLTKQEEKMKKIGELTKESVAICKDLYPKMPNECKTEITTGDKKETRGFTVQQVKANCETALKDHKELNKAEESLPERNDGTIDKSGRVDTSATAAAEQNRQIILQKTNERDEAALRLREAEASLLEKKGLKTKADGEAQQAKADSDANPTDDAKKTLAQQKAEAAKTADDAVKAADKLVQELRLAVQGAEAALRKAKGESRDAAKEKLVVELVSSLKAKIEKAQVVSIENLTKVAPTDEEEVKQARDTTALLFGGALITYKQFKDKVAKGEKGLACRAILLPSEVKNGEAELLDVNDDSTTDRIQVLNLLLKSKEADKAFTIRCAKASATEQMTLEEVEAALKGVVTLVKKVAQAPAADQSGAATAGGTGAAPVPARPAAPAAPPRAEEINSLELFKGKVLRIALNSFFISSNEAMAEKLSESKSIISGLPIAANVAVNRSPISSERGLANLAAGKTVCVVTHKGSKIATTDLDNKKSELLHRVVSATTFRYPEQIAIRIQTAAISTKAEDDLDHEKASGAKFTCYKKNTGEGLTLDEIRQGLQGAVNSIVNAN